VQNDPDLYVDLESNEVKIPSWNIQITEKKNESGSYVISFIRSSDREVHKISTEQNLLSGKAFELSEQEFRAFHAKYEHYIGSEFSYTYLDAIWSVYCEVEKSSGYSQFVSEDLEREQPKTEIDAKALRCALEKKRIEHLEKTRERYVPKVIPGFIDETPYFQSKLHEFIIKAKLQKLSGSGIILLAGPPSTGKSVFLKFVSNLMNREYFEHTSDKWQTKNSLVTAIKFGEYGPYTIPAGFTKAITTSHSLINIEEIKEWPEALRKSLNPFFAGSKIFTAPDGTRYEIGDDILLCAAANLGSMYRIEDEPFTADFWSRIEVVEYNYAPEYVSDEYYTALMTSKKENLITTQDLVQYYFNYHEAPSKAEDKAKFFSKQFLEFILLPKADEAIKRDNLAKYIIDYFAKGNTLTKGARSQDRYFSPEEAIKIAYKSGQTEIEGTNREFIKCVHLLELMGKM